MQELVINENIKNRIYTIRGLQVMLDSDLAILYECKNGTKTINQGVKRNQEKFPSDFYFKLTKEEYEEILRSQFGTLKLDQGKYSKYPPYAFTEQGVAMLASIIKTKVATKMSINIMRTFIIMKKYISNMYYYNQRQINIEEDIILLKNDVSWLLSKFDEEIIPKDKTFYNGSFFDAYELINKIINSATKKIVIIDNYLDKSIFKYIKEIDLEISLICSKNYEDLKEIIEIYNKQYPNIKVFKSNKFHDRYMIIDDKYYLVGSSFNNIGGCCGSISLLNDVDKINEILKDFLLYYPKKS